MYMCRYEGSEEWGWGVLYVYGRECRVGTVWYNGCIAYTHTHTHTHTRMYIYVHIAAADY